ncbi:MAG TPA: GNAT family N-acetyltransferase [Kofleriaceae bacterium]|nr:GNAT family N-acetyltransferase [Kofleriaceae bacterium]
MQILASPFDSQHYGLAIGRLVREAEDRADDLHAAVETARRERFAVVFVRLAEGDPLCGVLARAGHAPVDTLVTSTLGSERPEIRGNATIAVEHHDRLDDPADVAAAAAITMEGMRTSHLHADPRLPIARTRELYAAWARNDVTHRAQRTIVARAAGAAGELIGFLSVLAAPGTAAIDLIAVAAARHGQGVGGALLASFIAWIGDRGTIATVGTQADNPARRLYARAGFVPTATHFTYHLWIDP